MFTVILLLFIKHLYINERPPVFRVFVLGGAVMLLTLTDCEIISLNEWRQSSFSLAFISIVIKHAECVSTARLYKSVGCYFISSF